MLRNMLVAVGVLAICASGSFAAEIKGKLTKFDKDKNTITVEVDGKATDYKVDKDTKYNFGTKDVKEGAEYIGKILERVKDKGLPVVLEVEKDTVKKLQISTRPQQ